MSNNENENENGQEDDGDNNKRNSLRQVAIKRCQRILMRNVIRKLSSTWWFCAQDLATLEIQAPAWGLSLKTGQVLDRRGQLSGHSRSGFADFGLSSHPILALILILSFVRGRQSVATLDCHNLVSQVSLLLLLSLSSWRHMILQKSE